jgi:flagellar motor switch protein FliG
MDKTEKILETPSFSGVTKAVLWLLSTEESMAIATIGKLSDSEVRKIRRAVESVSKPTEEMLTAVHAEFMNMLSSNKLQLHGQIEYLEQLARKALGDRAHKVLTTRETESSKQARLSDADVDVLASLLTSEHPQVVAAVLSSMSAMRRNDVIARMPAEMHKEVIERVAKLSTISMEALAKAEKILSTGMPVNLDKDFDVEGLRVAASMLNGLDPEESKEILDAMAVADGNLAAELKKAMFPFEDLVRVDKRSLQMLLKQVKSDQLTLALKVAGDELREKIFSCLSKRAAETMREEMALLGPVRITDVEQAQVSIMLAAQKLVSEGKMSLSGEGNDDIL